MTEQGNRPPVSYYQNGTSGSVSGEYFILSGTSMATAAVSGGAALLIQKNPTFTPDQVKASLMKAAHKACHSTRR
jgi:serine protease AprX